MATKGETKETKDETKKVIATPKKIPLTPVQQLDKSIALLEKGVTNKDDRLIKRLLRNNSSLRKTLTNTDLITAYQFYVPSTTPNHASIVGALSSLPASSGEVSIFFGDSVTGDDENKMEIVDDTSATKEPRTEVLPEVEIYFHLMVLSRIVRQARSNATATPGLLPQCVSSATLLIQRLATFSRHSLDIIGSKAYMLYSLVHELSDATTFLSIRPTLFSAYRTACLRRDNMGRATLVNLLLRNYLHFNHYELALKLLDGIPEEYPSSVSNNQFVRYLYYTGRVYAISCDYGEAHQQLNVALRKAPQRTARGFRIAAQQLDCLVQLLIGEVPERSLFNAVDTREALEPYLELTQAVRLGELSAFTTAIEKHLSRFVNDGNLSLVQRLRHSVIKTGLRNISLSYSRISFVDIATKLKLDTALDAEYMCAKAIRDGVIEASLNHDGGYLASNTSGNVYSTTQPQEQFHQRIEFCLSVHNDAVRGMQYPSKKDASKKSDSKEDDEEEETIEGLIAEAEQDGLDEDAMEED